MYVSISQHFHIYIYMHMDIHGDDPFILTVTTGICFFSEFQDEPSFSTPEKDEFAMSLTQLPRGEAKERGSYIPNVSNLVGG